jgi:hypothetical protein
MQSTNLDTTSLDVFVHIDHSTIIYLMNKVDVKTRIIRWLLLLQEFGLTIFDNLRKQNVVEDFLSRLTNHAEQEAIDNSFLNEHMFAISMQTPQFVDISNYIGTQKFSHHFS